MWNFYEWVFRLSALLIIPILLIDIEIYFLIQILIFLHINMGLVVIISDYIHIKKVKTIFLFSLRILAIEILRCSLELLL